MNDVFAATSFGVGDSRYFRPKVGHPGRVPLDVLIPDPGQPRKHFNEAELRALAATMRKENGGEQRDIVTVRELTEQERREHPSSVWFVLVGGERRWRAAPLAKLADLEVRVKSYKNRAEIMLDMFMLNENRVGLSDIENANYLAKLVDEFGWKTSEEIAERTGKPHRWVLEHRALFKLSPKARVLMSPELKKQDRIKKHVGVFLSRLSHSTQDDFAERMPKSKDRATALQQLRWMREQLKGTPEEVSPAQFRPSILRRIVGYYGQQVKHRAQTLVAMESFDQLFENATFQQIVTLLADVKDAHSVLGGLIARVDSLAIAAKTATKPAEVPSATRPVTPAQIFASVPRPVAKPTSRPAEPIRSRVREVVASLQKIAQTRETDHDKTTVIRSGAPAFASADKQTVNYKDPSKGYTQTSVDWPGYLKLRDAGVLHHQVMGIKPPEYIVEWENAHKTT